MQPESAKAAARPIDDVRGTVEHRLHLVETLTKRSPGGCRQRAQGRNRMSKRSHVTTTVNGEAVDFLCEPRQSLLEVLRDVLCLTGTKEGCNDGNCGACSVIMDGVLVDSCCVLGVEAEGSEIETVEGMAQER